LDTYSNEGVTSSLTDDVDTQLYGNESYFGYTDDVTETVTNSSWLNGTDGSHTSWVTESSLSTESGSEAGGGFGLGGVTGLPETSTDGSLLAWITREQGEAYPTNEFVLYDSPRTVAAYLSSPTGQLVVAGLGEVMFDDPFDLAVGFVPSTNAMTAHGLPAEKVNTFNLAENNGPTDGVSQTSTSPPTSVLVTLAAAGRNPTDILIPTQAGTEGSGEGDDEDDDAETATANSSAAGTASGSAPSGTAETTTTVVAASQPQQANGELQAEGEGSAQGSHLSPTWEGVKAFGASIWGNTGGALYKSYVTRGQKLGAGYGAVASNTTPVDLSLVAKQRAYLTQQLMDPNRQTAADETTVAQYRAADAQITGNFLRERAQDAKAVSEGLVAGVELAVDTYMIVDGGIAVKRAAGTLRAKAIERAAARTAATDGAPLGEAAAEGLAPKSVPVPPKGTGDIYVLGRQVDTAVAEGWPGHEVLNIPDWTIAKNDAFIQSIINKKGRVYLGSPQTRATLWDAVNNRETVFARELRQLKEAGYKQVGDYMVPPS
jgi:hypothetical protein